MLTKHIFHGISNIPWASFPRFISSFYTMKSLFPFPIMNSNFKYPSTEVVLSFQIIYYRGTSSFFDSPSKVRIPLIAIVLTGDRTLFAFYLIAIFVKSTSDWYSIKYAFFKVRAWQSSNST
jgi:hypothetical protein